VRDLGHSTASDMEVWIHAAAHQFVIVSKDANFHRLSLRLGHPPKIIWIRRGDCSTAEIEAILRRHQPDLLAFGQDTDSGSMILL
jgi:predicted nuclease of predicted toxin-antitoxin system